MPSNHSANSLYEVIQAGRIHVCVQTYGKLKSLYGFCTAICMSVLVFDRATQSKPIREEVKTRTGK